MANNKQKDPQHTFHLSFKVTVETGVDVNADSFEHALELAHATPIEELIDIKHDHDDSSLKLQGVWQQSEV